MGHLQAHQAGTFSPKPLGHFLILRFRGRSLLFEYIKVLSRNTLQLLRHGQVDAGLGRQLGALDQQPEDGPCSQPTESSVQTFREEGTESPPHPGMLRAHQSQKGPWSPTELTCRPLPLWFLTQELPSLALPRPISSRCRNQPESCLLQEAPLAFPRQMEGPSPHPTQSLFLFCFWLHHAWHGILAPQPGIEPVAPAVEAQSLN